MNSELRMNFWIMFYKVDNFYESTTCSYIRLTFSSKACIGTMWASRKNSFPFTNNNSAGTLNAVYCPVKAGTLSASTSAVFTLGYFVNISFTCGNNPWQTEQFSRDT